MVKVRGGIGRESDWLEFAKLSAPSGRLYVMDPGMLPDAADGCAINLPPGEYSITAKVITYWKDSRVSRLRIAQPGATGTVGGKIGEVSTDLGTIGLADYERYFAAWNSDADGFQDSVSHEIPESGICKIAKISAGSGVEIPFVEAGFGDGCYPILSLEDAGNLVGVELEFIQPDEPYPF